MRMILTAAVALLIACALSACDSSEEESADVRLLSGAEVTISSSLKQCSTDASCTLVFTGCDGCCQRQAINKAFLDSYQDGFREACASYSGSVCDCAPLEQVARCVARRCEAIEVSD